MAKKKQPLFNHRANVLSYQPGKMKAIYPGMIVRFKYIPGYDDNPYLFVMWNDYEGRKLHGLNLNYMPEKQVQKLFCSCELLHKGASVYSKEPITRTIQSHASDYDDTLPYRNLLMKAFTRIKIPTYREERDGNPLSKSEARRQMRVLYQKIIKKVLRRFDMYRSYHKGDIKNLQVLEYELGGWSQPGMHEPGAEEGTKRNERFR